MSTLTEGKVVGDIILQERELNGSREELLMDESQTLVLGTVCRDGAGGRKVALTAKTNEVHTVTFTGLAAGVVMIGITHPVTGTVSWTDELAHAATKADIKTELETMANVDADDIIVGGTDIDAFTLTYSGGLWAGRAVPLVRTQMGDAATATASAVIVRTTKGGGAGGAAANEVQDVTWGTVAVPDAATSGSFFITGKDLSGDEVTTVAVAWNASAATLQAALDTAFGTDGVIGTTHTGADVDDGFTLTFSGAGYAGVDQDPITVDVTTTPLVLTTLAVAYALVEGTKGRPGGTQEANSICIKAATTVGSALTTKTVFLTNTAVVNLDQLDFGDGDKDDAIRELNDNKQIKMRTQPTTTETQTS